MTSATNQTVTCPECGASFPLDADITANEIVPCTDCGIELEVISLAPLEVEIAPDIEEDWGE